MNCIFLICLSFWFWNFPVFSFKEITRIPAYEIESPDHFYKCFAHEPVIVQGACEGPENIFLREFTFERAAELLRGQQLKAFNQQSVTYWDTNFVDSEAFFKASQPLNVVTHALSDSPLAGKVSIPSFLSYNWLHPESPETNVSLVLTGKSFVTKWHEDRHQQWMYLTSGQKEWSFLPPPYRTTTGDFRADVPSYDETRDDMIRGILQQDELLFFPSGWSHKVTTLENSAGIAGEALNEHFIRDDVDMTLARWLGFRAAQDPIFLKAREIVDSYWSAVNEALMDPEIRQHVESELRRLDVLFQEVS